MNALCFPPSVLQDVYGNGPTSLAGGAAGTGRAEVADGGYVLNGDWQFGSGSAESTWIIGRCQVFQPGSQTPDPAAPPPLGYYALFPISEAVVDDNWDVAGLRATSSHDYHARNVFIPKDRVAAVGAVRDWSGPLYAMANDALAPTQFGAIASGIAKRAGRAVRELAMTKVPSASGGKLLQERVQVQEAVARAYAKINASCAFRDRVVAETWEYARLGKPLTPERRADIRLAGLYSCESAVEAVDLMWRAAATSAIKETSVLAHCFRDIHVLETNVNVTSIRYEQVGRVLLGLEPNAAL